MVLNMAKKLHLKWVDIKSIVCVTSACDIIAKSIIRVHVGSMGTLGFFSQLGWKTHQEPKYSISSDHVCKMYR